jgi:hypothetical protein
MSQLDNTSHADTNLEQLMAYASDAFGAQVVDRKEGTITPGDGVIMKVERTSDGRKSNKRKSEGRSKAPAAKQVKLDKLPVGTVLCYDQMAPKCSSAAWHFSRIISNKGKTFYKVEKLQKVSGDTQTEHDEAGYIRRTITSVSPGEPHNAIQWIVRIDNLWGKVEKRGRQWQVYRTEQGVHDILDHCD